MLAFDMGDVVILETAQHMGHGIDFADIGQELVAQAFAFGGAAHQAGDVDKGDAGGNDLRDPAILARVSSRGSGTATSPTLGSMVQKG